MLLLLLSIAFAQEPAEQAWLVEDAPSLRFPDAEVAGPEFDAEQRVTVLFREDERVRVRSGNDYGWVPAEVLTTEAPEGAEPPPSAAPAGDFDMKALEDLLQRTEGL